MHNLTKQALDQLIMDWAMMTMEDRGKKKVPPEQQPQKAKADITLL